MFKFNKLASLQIFQLLRFGAFTFIGMGLAKLQLSQTDIGQYETFIWLSGMVSFFWVGGIINSTLALYPNKSETEKKDVLLSTFISLSALSLLAAAFLFVFSPNLLLFMHKESGNRLVHLSAVFLLLSGPAYIAEYILFLNGKKTAIAVYAIINAVLTLGCALIPVAITGNVEYAMYGLIIVAALKLIFTITILQKFATLRPDGSLLLKTMAQNLKVSSPIIASLFVSGSGEYIDGLIVKTRFDDMFFAVYRYGAKELPVLFIIANTFSTAMVSSVAANFDEGLKELKKKSARLMHIFFPLTIILMPLSPYLYKYFFNDSFIYSSLIFNVYLLLAIPRLLFPQTVLTGMQKTRFLFISSVFEIIINVSLSVYLSAPERMGLAGIALGTFIAYSFDKIFLILVNRFYFKIPVSKYVPIIPYFVYVVFTFVALFCSLQVLRNM
jgi:O-antigen/teichoic acid export membrane protein